MRWELTTWDLTVSIDSWQHISVTSHGSRSLTPSVGRLRDSRPSAAPSGTTSVPRSVQRTRALSAEFYLADERDEPARCLVSASSRPPHVAKASGSSAVSTLATSPP